MFLVAFLFWTGTVEDANNVQQIPMTKVELTLSGDELKKLEQFEYSCVKRGKGSTLEPFVERNKKLNKMYGPGHLVRASPTRAAPVLVDLEHPGERFWAIENSPVVRYGLLGYTISFQGPGKLYFLIILV